MTMTSTTTDTVATATDLRRLLLVKLGALAD
jgi:hypothetical protein